MTPVQRDILRLLRREGALSRWQLHQRTGLRPNSVGQQVARLIHAGLVAEQAAAAEGRGRPRVPLVIDPQRRHVIGLALRPGQVEAVRLNLQGQPLGLRQVQKLDQPTAPLPALRKALKPLLNEQTWAVACAIPGFFDPAGGRILLSSAVAAGGTPAIAPLQAMIEPRPLALDNDMHALAARWLLTFQQPPEEDVLLVYLDDGQLGAAMLVGGAPNRGCLVGGNELGHTRLPVATERCYCGHTGCLERICSTAFLQQRGRGSKSITLAQAVAGYGGKDARLDLMLELLATGLANVVNFMRPHRLVLVSEFTRSPRFADALVRQVRGKLLSELAGRVRLDLWDQPQAQSAETAGWLALAGLYFPDWMRPATATLAAR